MFIHLHNHSHYSLLDGLAKIDDYIAKALEYKMPALGLTDHGNMFGIVEFYQKCKTAGIKPILGCEMYVAPRDLHLRHYGKDNKPFHLILFAKNNQGYKNLMYLNTIAHLDGFYYKPRIDKKALAKRSEGLIATSACRAGEVARAIQENKWDKAVQVVREYQEIFGKENFYIELEYLGDNSEQHELNKKLVKLAQETEAPLVGSRDTHYINQDDKQAQDALVCIATGKVLSDERRLNMTDVDLSFLQPKLMEKYFNKLDKEIIKNTQKIAEKCDVKIELGNWYFPKFELPNGVTAEEELKKIARQGLQEKFPQADKKIKERLEYELDVICEKGYAPYFLIVADLINFARERKIPTTTRGSAAGSLVGHVTGIIPIDPLYFELPFERFLNPFRISAPDIDMDFADNRREEVLEYARQKYGYDKVANICTFGTMAARGSVRDVTRVLGLEYEFGDRLAKLIPFGAQGFPMTISKALNKVSELKEIYNSDPQAKQVLDLARKVEGCARHVSVHAAGVVISPTILTDFTPLQKDPTGQRGIITQYEMHACEDVGLIKFDFLGIRNLSILGDTVQIIKKQKNIEIDLEDLPLDESHTFGFIAKGFTFGMFQLGGSGMTKWLTELKPTKVKELAAMIALFRPGPMESIPEYIARKQGKKPIQYLDPKLEPILKDTYGVITYQDDLLLIAINVAGYTWESVDKFRKAVGKKIPKLMAQQEKQFIRGCQEHSGWPKAKAEKLWRLFDPFKGYGFNKAHAASYAMISYQTAYLKAHYTAEFMTAVLSAESQNTDKVVEAVAECKRMGIKVLPPDVNYSRPDFTYISDKEIRFGLLAIKNFGSDIANVIITERKRNGQFKDLEDFLKRIQSRNLNKKSLDALIRAGALDSLGERNQMLQNLNRILSFVKYKNKQRQTKQSSLFSQLASEQNTNELVLPPTPDADLKTKLVWEKELLGLYVSGHPFAKMNDLVKKYVTFGCSQVRYGQQQIKVCGIISKIHKFITKTGKAMAFVTLEDMTGELEVLVFPRTFNQTVQVWQEDQHVYVIGKLSKKEEEKPKLIVDLAYNIHEENIREVALKADQEASNINNNFGYNNNSTKQSFNQPSQPQAQQKTQKVWITLPKFFNSQIHQQLKKIFNQFKGSSKVYLMINQAGNLRKIETEFKVSYNLTLKQKLEEIIGSGNIKAE